MAKTITRRPAKKPAAKRVTTKKPNTNKNKITTKKPTGTGMSSKKPISSVAKNTNAAS